MTTQWTDSAKQALDHYFGQMRVKLSTSGADAREVIDDLERHIDHEIAAANLRVVTEQDVRRILGQIGSPELGPEQRGGVAVEEPPAVAEKPPGRRSRNMLLLFCGVILPVVAIGLELATHMCAGVFFDPIPTWWHVGLAATVPLANLAGWIALRRGTQRWHAVMAANGAAIVIGLYFSILYLPLAPLAAIAVAFLGWGLLPLSPMFSFGAALVLRSRLRRLAPDYAPKIRWGYAAALLALGLVVAPEPLTRYLAHAAQSDDAQKRGRAVKWLRAVGSREILLRDCYGTTRWAQRPFLGFNVTGTALAVEPARALYFRVTGQPFNAVAPPQRNFARGGWGALNEFTWDQEQGGNAVGARVKGVSMSQSRVDGLVDADAGWCYTEWTLEFKNVATVAREARAQIALPPGGVVSRLTLWVNGEEREAAFAGSQQVREAYRQVVVVQRRDPVLVTSCGPDRVLMQCFPVPANGGTIKVRLGVTAPLTVESPGEAVIRLPYFAERNFGIDDAVSHSLWLEAGQPIESPGKGLVADSARAARYALRGTVSDRDLSGRGAVLRLKRTATAREFWVEDHGTQDGSVIVQRLQQTQRVLPKRMVLVVDASQTMRSFLPEIAAALKGVPPGVPVSVLLAKDGVEELVVDGTNVEETARELRRAKPEGGHDNVPALVRAWDLAGSDGLVIWVHGPQPVLAGSVEALQQRVFWKLTTDAGSGPTIYSVQTAEGPNRILEKVESAWAVFRSTARFGKLEEDLGRVFLECGGGGMEWVRERSTTDRMPAGTSKASRHVARLWGFEEVKRLVLAKQTGDAIKLAGVYQLVTPVSGAVVLESKEQFDQAGLTPVDVNTVPVVPEPGVIVLLVLGLVLLVGWRWGKGFRWSRVS